MCSENVCRGILCDGKKIREAKAHTNALSQETVSAGGCVHTTEYYRALDRRGKGYTSQLKSLQEMF